MNTSLQFFMTKVDEDEFVKAFKNADYDEIEESKWQIMYHCGDEHVQFLRSDQYEGLITEGRIAIKTNHKNDSSLRCDTLYKNMRNWIKKNYSNNLVLYNTKLQTRDEAVFEKNWWVSKEVKNLIKDNDTILKPSKNSFVVYEIISRYNSRLM